MITINLSWICSLLIKSILTVTVMGIIWKLYHIAQRFSREEETEQDTEIVYGILCLLIIPFIIATMLLFGVFVPNNLFNHPISEFVWFDWVASYVVLMLLAIVIEVVFVWIWQWISES